MVLALPPSFPTSLAVVPRCSVDVYMPCHTLSLLGRFIRGGAENKIGQNEMLNAVQPDLVTGGEVSLGSVGSGCVWFGLLLFVLADTTTCTCLAWLGLAARVGVAHTNVGFVRSMMTLTKT